MPTYTSSTTTSTKKAAKTLDGRLLCASALAYEIREPYLSGAGFLSPPKEINKGVNSCLLGTTRDGIVIAFRGTTNDVGEWLQNTSSKLIPFQSSSSKGNKGRVHKGFYTALFKTGWSQEIRNALVPLLSSCPRKNYKTKKCKVFLTGHSKGGCLASLYALELFIVQIYQVPNMSVLLELREDSAKMTALVESVQKEQGCRALGSPSCANQTKIWDYAPVGDRKYLSHNGQIVHHVSQDLDHRRIREFESKTILRLGEFRQAHCSSCPDASNGCSGGYFKAIAPEICQSAE